MRYAKIFLVFVLMGTFFLWSVPVTQVQAVVKNTTITGLPPNTMITIELPDGTTDPEKQKTDDKGELVYLFPDGKSTLTWAGGSKVVNISSGEVVNTWSGTETTIAAVGGIAAVTALGLAASNSSDNGDGSPAVSTGSGGGSTGGGSTGGDYSTNFNVISDPSGHEPFIGLASSSPNPLTVTVAGSSISITGQPPFVNDTGTISGDSFTAEGTGTVAGISNVRVTMGGNISESDISGTYSMGVGGNLPGGNAAVYSFSGSK